ncbi:DUF928 domain-containing protein [Spirulina sp. CS-785/01]|uniref:DUF928 domain-containing protein n=1 Tax=Spirulina sp. CS-785/01 TaxID=3021716 RepID=UPI00232D6762|nr:DUF928 domain-containing protein [Spirulina sp. CS-785/01]MDB9315848.1 DUF928 domain-containing protein [Spirulina sp. CS-785/01]
MVSFKSQFSPRLGQFLSITLLTSLALFSVQAVRAQNIPNQWQNHNYTPPSNLGSPDRMEAGGTRSGSELSVTPLVPQTHKFGVTLESNPSLYVYAPGLLDPELNRFVVVELMNADHKMVYRTEIEVSGNAGILRLQLPETHPETGDKLLETEENYYWTVSVLDSYDEIMGTAQGWIRQVPTPSDLASQLAEVPPHNKARLLAEKGIWYDALDQLAQAYADNPNDSQVQADWVKLLKAADLSDFSQAMIMSPQVATLPNE